MSNLCIAVLCRGTDAKVHWWYWPDSYDEYIPADVAPEALDPDKLIKGKCCMRGEASCAPLDQVP